MLKICLLRYSMKENPNYHANGFENGFTFERIEWHMVIITIIIIFDF